MGGAAYPHVSSESMSALRVAVIGYGLAGRIFHAPFVSAIPGFELAAIVTSSRREQAMRDYPEANVVATPEELFADPELDLIVVGTPNETHFDLASRALAAGKHVVLDKPFTNDASSARNLVGLARTHNRVLAPFHNRRFDNDFLTVSRLVEEGTLGRISQVISHYDRFRPIQRPNTWKEVGAAGGGILYDLGPHLVDQPLALYGAPQRITASVRRDRDQTDINDAFSIVLEYDRPDGYKLLYECHATMLAADPAPRFRVHGTHGSYTKFGLDPQEAALLGGAKPPRLNDANAPAWLPEPESAWGKLTLATERAEPVQLESKAFPSVTGDYRRFYLQVRDAILGHAPLAISTEDGYRSIRLLDLALQSSHERRTLDITFDL